MKSFNRYRRKRVKKKKKEDPFLTKVLFSYLFENERYFYVGGHVKDPIFVKKVPSTQLYRVQLESTGIGVNDWAVTFKFSDNNPDLLASTAEVIYGKPSLGSNWSITDPLVDTLLLVGPGFFSSRIFTNPFVYSDPITDLSFEDPPGDPQSSNGYGTTSDVFGSTIVTSHNTNWSVSKSTGISITGSLRSGLSQPLVGFNYTGTNLSQSKNEAIFTWIQTPSGPGDFGPYGFSAPECAEDNAPPEVFGTTTHSIGRARVRLLEGDFTRSYITQKPTFSAKNGLLTLTSGSVSVIYASNPRVSESFGYGNSPPSAANWRISGYGNTLQSITYEYGCQSYATGNVINNTRSNRKYFLLKSSSTNSSGFQPMTKVQDESTRTPFNFEEVTQMEVLPGVFKDYSSVGSGGELDEVFGRKIEPSLARSTSLEGYGFYFISDTGDNVKVTNSFSSLVILRLFYETSNPRITFYKGVGGVEYEVTNSFLQSSTTYKEEGNSLRAYQTRLSNALINSLFEQDTNISVELREALKDGNTLVFPSSVSETLEDVGVYKLDFQDGGVFPRIEEAKYYPN